MNRTLSIRALGAAIVLLALPCFPAHALRAVWSCAPQTGYTAPDGTVVVIGGLCTVKYESEPSDYVQYYSNRGSREGDSGWVDTTDRRVSERVQAEVLPPCGSSPTTSQPVTITTGNKIKPELDFAVLPDEIPLTMLRTYDKSLNRSGMFGARWASSLEYTLTFERGATQCAGRLDALMACSSTDPITTIHAVRPSGYGMPFTLVNGIWTHPKGTMAAQGSNWVLTLDDGTVETYDAYGRPVTIVSSRGVGLSYAYNANNQLATITHTSGRSIQLTWSGTKVVAIVAPNGKAYGYGYTSGGAGVYLASVVYPDNLGTRTYHYESAEAGGLTGISVNGVRYSRYAYQSDGRAAWSGLEGGVDRSTFAYGTDYTNVTNALGQTTKYLFATLNGSKQVIGVERPASAACAAGATYTAYDVNGNIDYQLDALGVKEGLNKSTAQ